MRTNSPTPDSDPFTQVVTQPKPEKPAPSDIQKIANSENYPQFKAYIDQKKEFYRNYMPGGESITKFDDEEAGRWWKCAATIIAELDVIDNMLRNNRTAPEVKTDEQT